MDGGVTFGNIVNLSNNPAGSEEPTIAASGKNVYVVWRDSASGNSEIVFRYSTNGGTSFEPTKNLSNTPKSSGAPAIAVNDDDVYVVWADSTGTPPVHPDILFRHSTDGGTSFGSSINLSANGGDSSSPDIAVTKQN